MTAKILKLNAQAKAVVLYVLRDETSVPVNGSYETGNAANNAPFSPLRIVYKA